MSVLWEEQCRYQYNKAHLCSKVLPWSSTKVPIATRMRTKTVIDDHYQLLGDAVRVELTALQQRYEIINTQRDFCAYQYASSWACSHTVAAKKLRVIFSSNVIHVVSIADHSHIPSLLPSKGLGTRNHPRKSPSKFTMYRPPNSHDFVCDTRL